MALDRDLVVATALDLLDEVGLDGITLRGIAERLGVKAPALYWHFPSKQALIDEMATAVIRELLTAEPPSAPAGPSSSGPSPSGPSPSGPSGPNSTSVRDGAGQSPVWEARLLRIGRELRAALLRRRDGARMVSGTYLTDDSLLAAMEPPLRELTDAGFALQDAVRAYTTVYSYTIGFTIEEQATSGDRRYDPATRRARFDAEAYPLTAAAGAVFAADQDERFDGGLAVILAGLRTLPRDPGSRQRR